MKIGVKFCGGCNPYIDRKRLVEKVKAIIPPGKFTFEYFDFDDCEVFLVVNGCSLACAKVEQDKKAIIIAGFEISGKQYLEEDLPGEVAKRLLAITSV